MTFAQMILAVLGADRYGAHAICLSNDRLVMIFFAAGNLVTWASYTAIGLTMIVYATRILSISVRARQLIGLFVFLCGGHHLCEVLTLFVGVYRLELMVDMAMAGVSAITAILTVMELPRNRRQGLG